MARKQLWIAGLALGLQASAVLASVVPQAPAPHYVDEDPAAIAHDAPPGQKAQFRRYLDAQLQAHPDPPILLVLADGSWAADEGFVEHTRHWNDERQDWMRRAREAWRRQRAATTN